MYTLRANRDSGHQKDIGGLVEGLWGVGAIRGVRGALELAGSVGAQDQQGYRGIKGIAENLGV